MLSKCTNSKMHTHDERNTRGIANTGFPVVVLGLFGVLLGLLELALISLKLVGYLNAFWWYILAPIWGTWLVSSAGFVGVVCYRLVVDKGERHHQVQRRTLWKSKHRFIA